MVKSMKRFLIVLVLLVVIVAAALKLFIYELPRVAGNDMAPALQPGDLLLANRLSTKPERGQIVLMEHPEIKTRVLLRRVVGLPGERVVVHAEVPAIDGKPAKRKTVSKVRLTDMGRELPMRLVEESLAGVTYRVLKDPARRSVDPKPVLLGPDQYFVLSDNRNHGTDSRTFGPVPADRIRAVVTHRVSAGPGSLSPQEVRDGWQHLK